MALQKELDTARELAEKAGKMLLAEAARAGGPRGSGQKAEVDDEIDAFLSEQLHRAFPEDTILSEEGGLRAGKSDRVFLVDPHDGTRDFLLGRRETSISIALLVKDRPVLGVVHTPFSTPLTGANGFLISWAEGQPLRDGDTVAALSAPPKSLTEQDRVLISTRVKGNQLEENRLLLFPARLETCPSIATRLALAASGRIAMGLTIHTLSPWDFAGGQALLRGVGSDLVLEDGLVHTWVDGCTPTREGRAYFGARDLSLAISIAQRYQRHFFSQIEAT